MKKQFMFLIIACSAVYISSNPFGIFGTIPAEDEWWLEYVIEDDFEEEEDEQSDNPEFIINYQYDSISEQLRDLIHYCITADADTLSKYSYVANLITIEPDSAISPETYEISIETYEGENNVASFMSSNYDISEIDTNSIHNKKNWGVYYVDDIPNYIWDPTGKFVGKRLIDKPVKLPFIGSHYIYEGIQNWYFLVEGDKILLTGNRFKRFYVELPEFAIPISLDQPFPEIPMISVITRPGTYQ